MKFKKRIALIFGGEGVEREISEASAENLARLIDQTGEDIEILPIGITANGKWYIYGGAPDKIGCGKWKDDKAFLTETYPINSSFKTENAEIKVHCALPCLHGEKGEDGMIAGVLENAHIRYIGEGVCPSALCADKAYTRAVAALLGIPTADGLLLTETDTFDARSLCERYIGYPMFLKPTRLGSSYGAHPVKTKDAFDSAYFDASRYNGRVLAERLADIDYEAECAFFSDGTYIGYEVGRINSGGAFYSFDAKYKSRTQPATADGIEPSVKKKIIEYSRSLVKYIGIKSMSRIDFFVCRDGNILFNEINTFPGMTKTSLYPVLTEKMGLASGEFIVRLINKACFQRNPEGMF